MTARKEKEKNMGIGRYRCLPIWQCIDSFKYCLILSNRFDPPSNQFAKQRGSGADQYPSYVLKFARFLNAFNEQFY
jgi:hypothetical protein